MRGSKLWKERSTYRPLTRDASSSLKLKCHVGQYFLPVPSAISKKRERELN